MPSLPGEVVGALDFPLFSYSHSFWSASDGKRALNCTAILATGESSVVPQQEIILGPGSRDILHILVHILVHILLIQNEKSLSSYLLCVTDQSVRSPTVADSTGVTRAIAQKSSFTEKQRARQKLLAHHLYSNKFAVTGCGHGLEFGCHRTLLS